MLYYFWKIVILKPKRHDAHQFLYLLLNDTVFYQQPLKKFQRFNAAPIMDIRVFYVAIAGFWLKRLKSLTTIDFRAFVFWFTQTSFPSNFCVIQRVTVNKRYFAAVRCYSWASVRSMYSICVAHVLFRIEVDVVSCIFVHTETHRQTHRDTQTDRQFQSRFSWPWSENRRTVREPSF